LKFLYFCPWSPSFSQEFYTACLVIPTSGSSVNLFRLASFPLDTKSHFLPSSCLVVLCLHWPGQAETPNSVVLFWGVLTLVLIWVLQATLVLVRLGSRLCYSVSIWVFLAQFSVLKCGVTIKIKFFWDFSKGLKVFASVTVSCLSLWQNTWHKQLRRRKCLFGLMVLFLFI
jgi:hypothetical protein